MAPGPGTVAQVLAQAGGEVQAGAPVVKLSDKRLTAEFEPATAQNRCGKTGRLLA